MSKLTPEEKRKDWKQRAAAGLAVPIVGEMAGNYALGPLADRVNRSMLADKRGQASDDTIRSFIDKNDLKVRLYNVPGFKHHSIHEGGPYSSPSEGMGPHVYPRSVTGNDFHLVNMEGNGSRNILMHELGHALVDDSESKALKLSKKFMKHWSGSGYPFLSSFALAADDDTRAYAGAPLVVGHVADQIEEAQANHAAYKHMAKEQGGKAARDFALRTALPNTISYALPTAATVGGVYAAGKLYEKARDKYRSSHTKQASTVKPFSHHVAEALKDFGVISAADLAALAVYDKMQENKNPYAEQIVKRANAIVESTTGTRGIAARQAAYTRNKSHVPHAMAKSASFTSMADNVIHTAHGGLHLINQGMGHLTGGHIQKYVANKAGITDAVALDKLNSAKDDELLSKFTHGSKEHSDLVKLIQMRKASRAAGGVVAAKGAYDYITGGNDNETMYR